MAGPSIALNVTGTGKESIDALNVSLERLKGNLSSMKVAKPDLGSLDSLTAEFQKFRNQFVELAQGQKTALAELVEVIKGGYTRAARTAKQGAEDLATSAESATKAAGSRVALARRNLQKEFEAVAATGNLPPAALDLASKLGVSLFPDQKLALDGYRTQQTEIKAAIKEETATLTAEIRTAKAQVDAAWASRSNPAVSKDAAWAAFDRDQAARLGAANKQVEEAKGFAALKKKEVEIRERAELDGAAAIAKGIAEGEKLIETEMAAQLREEARWMAERIAVRDTLAKEDLAATARRNAAFNALEKQQMTEQSRLRKEAEAAYATRAGGAPDTQNKPLEEARMFAANEKAAAAERVASMKAAAEAESRGLLEAAKEFEAAQQREIGLRQAAARHRQQELQRIAEADAAFQARGAKSQLGTAVQARAQLDQGISPEQVKQQYGGLALAAAQGAKGLNELKVAHEAASNSIAEGTPKVHGLKQALTDAHGAVKGLASGFGQALPMFASIGTFLAGAALSHSFVQVVKQGSEVAHTLEIIGTLGGNTAHEVDQVKTALLDLSAKGPFGPLEVAEAFKTLSLAGLSAKEQLSSIRDVLNFSVASGGGVSLEDSAKSLVAIGTAFKYTAEGYGRVADIVSKAAAISMSDVSDFAVAVRTASVVATTYHVSLESIANQIAGLAQIGIRGTSAGTAIRNFYDQLTAGTPKVVNTLNALKLKVRYETGELKGELKNYIEFIAELDAALKKRNINPAGEATIIRNLTNNRSSKELAEGLEAYRKKLTTLGEDGAKAFTTQIQSQQKQIVESYGFAAIAAANLAVTSKNQMLSVVSAFQGSLVSAFDAVEPTVIVLSARMREAFGSEEFKKTVVDLVTTVGNFTVFLVDHARVIGLVIAAYAGWKVAALGFTFFSQLGLMVGSASTALGAFATRQAAVAAETGVATAMSNIGTRAGVAAKGLMAVAKSLPLIGTAVTIAAAAWEVYEFNSVKASVNSATASQLAAGAVIQNLKDQAKALDEKNRLLAAGMSLQQATMLSDEMMARQKLANQTALDRKALESAVASEEAVKNRSRVRGMTGRDGVAHALPDPAGLVKARKDLEDFDAKAKTTADDLVTWQKTVREKSKTEADLIAAAMKAAAGKPGTKDFTVPVDPSKGASSEFGALKSVHSETESEIKRYYDEQQKLLDKSHAGKLLSDSEYQLKTEQLARAGYANEIGETEHFIQASNAALARMGDKKGVEVTAAREKIRLEVENAKQLLEYRKQSAEIDKAARENKETLQLNTDLAKLREGVNLEQAKLDVELRFAGMLPELRAAEEARVATEEKYAELLRQKLTLLKQVEEAERASFKTPGDVSRAENGGTLNQYQAEIDRLRKEIERINAAKVEQGQRSADIKLKSPEFFPTWKKNLDEWKNTTTSMRKYWDEMVNGIVDKGRDIWDNFTKTGKLHFGSLLEFIRDQLSKVAYEQLIAPYFTSLGKKIADLTLGKRPGGEPGATDKVGDAYEAITNRKGKETAGTETQTWDKVMASKAAEVWGNIKSGASTAWDALKSGASTVWESIQGGASPLLDLFKNFGSSISGLIQSLISWASTLLSSGSAGGLGGLAGLFGGGGSGSGGGGFNNAGGSGDFGLSLIESAKGNIFGTQGLQAFAKGDIFSSPTFFRFAQGGGFGNGVMGEAGPEAVMPLKRGPNGSLGVVNHGGSGGGMNVIINTPPGVVVEKQEKRDDGKTLEVWLSMAEKRAVAAVNKSIATGGSTAQVLNSRGVNTSGGLLRRD